MTLFVQIFKKLNLTRFHVDIHPCKTLQTQGFYFKVTVKPSINKHPEPH